MEKTATLDKVCLPIGKAKGLPNEHYTCSSVFQEEKDIFGGQPLSYLFSIMVLCPISFAIGF